MILRRITEHVKAQNWFAVAIDFVIVVVGVFAGLQVNNWNVERQNRVDEVYYLQRILNDIDESVSNNDQVAAFLDDKTKNASWVVDKLREGELEPGEEDIFNERFLGIEEWRTGDFLDSTVQELQSSGRVDIIRSKAFREQLGRFELKLESIRRAQSNIADFHKALTLEIAPRFDQIGVDQKRTLLTPFDQLAGDVDLIRYLHRYAQFYYWRRANVEELQDELAILREQTIVALAGRGKS